jgi:hypothetical protein
VGSECRRGEVLRLSLEAAATLRAFLSRPLDPEGAPRAVGELVSVARRARRSFLGHELKSQRVLAEVMGTS